MTTSSREPLALISLETLEPPQEFGQDGGQFYRCYDDFAEEIDKDMAEGLKEQLDGLLTFAGLFAGVNSAFLALTLPLMSADPNDDTNALLLQSNAILLQIALGRNMSIENPAPLPSAGFSPAKDLWVVNALFAVSLSFALISSFLAVLGRQWLVYYRKRGGGGADRQRWEQLRRFLGAERWHLELVLDDILPTLLQIGLILFCVALVLYLSTLDQTLSWIVGAVLTTALAILVLTAMFTTWDRFCPFHSPLSHFISWALLSLLHLFTRAPFWFDLILPYVLSLPTLVLDLCMSALYVVQDVIPGIHFSILDDYDPSSTLVTLLTGTRDQLEQEFAPMELIKVLPFARTDEELEWLKVKAIMRVITTSDDPISVSCAAANIIAIENRDTLHELWGDEEFCKRLIDLSHVSNEKTAQLRLHDHATHSYGAPFVGARLTRGALVHIFLMGSDLDLPVSRSTSSFFREPQGSHSALSIPSKAVHKSSFRSIRVSLVWKYILDREGFPNYVSEILDLVTGESGSREWHIPSGFTPAVVSLMTLAVSGAEMPDVWADVHGPYRANTYDMPGHISDSLIRRFIARYARPDARSKEDYILMVLLIIASKLVRSSNQSSGEDALTGVRLLTLGDSVMLLRNPDITPTALDLAKAFREEHAVTLRKIFKQLVNVDSEIPSELLSELADYFENLGKLGGRESTYDEDSWVISLFSTILNEFCLGPFAWKRYRLSPWHMTMGTHRPTLCDDVLRSFNALRARVYGIENKIHVSLQRHAKRDRDPEIRWCHC
ncbi:hypothetical protein FRC05_006705 [Tulasnella sp. 425]|nr:hypothetical protein FRC05_006705 [Tulasnella sp. 425]